jgi:hypothetical protein
MRVPLIHESQARNQAIRSVTSAIPPPFVSSSYAYAPQTFVAGKPIWLMLYDYALSADELHGALPAPHRPNRPLQCGQDLEVSSP